MIKFTPWRHYHDMGASIDCEIVKLAIFIKSYFKKPSGGGKSV